MKIYGDILSPFVRAALVTAHEVGLGSKVELMPIRVPPTGQSADMPAGAPLGKIPVLVTDHGHPLYDSRVIIEYLCHVAGDRTLIPDDGVKRFRVLTLQALGLGLAETAVAYRYETAMRPAGSQWQEWIGRQHIRFAAGFDDLENTWLRDLEQVSAGTIAVAVALAYIDYRLGELGWRTGRPALCAFAERFGARESMIRTPLPTG